MFRPSFLIFTIVISIFLAGCSSTKKISNSSADINASSSNTNISKAINIEGKWDGLIQHGLDFIYVRLKISKADSNGSSYQGVAYAQQFYGYVQGHSVTDDINAEEVPITLKFEPKINSFVITTERQARRGRLGLPQLLGNLGGVLDSRKMVLTGLRNSRGYRGGVPNTGDQYFLFSRPKRFKGIAGKFEEFIGNQGSISGIFGLFGGPDVDDIKKWAKKLYKEYPETDLYHIPFGQMDLLTIKLFRDKHFKKHFGDKFDELSDGDLAGFNKVLSKEMAKSRKKKTRSTSVMSRMFWKGRGDNNAKQTTFWVKAQRHFVNWRKQQLKNIKELAVSRESMASIQLLEAELAKVSKIVFWPSEISKHQASIKTAQVDIAKKLFAVELDTQITKTQPTMESLANLANFATRNKNFATLGAKQKTEAQQKIARVVNKSIGEAIRLFGQGQSGINGYRILQAWQQQYASIAGYLESGNLTKSEQVISKRRTEIENDVLTIYRASYSKQVLSQQPGAGSLKAGVLYEKRAIQELAIFNHSTQFQVFSRERADKRKQDLNLSKPDLSSLIQRQTKPSALNKIADAYLFPADRKLKVSRTVTAEISRKILQLEPFTGMSGDQYLNALYSADFAKLKQLDSSFSQPYREGMFNEGMTAFTGLMDALLKLGGKNNMSITNAYQESMKSMSLIVPIFAVYLVDYQYSYKACLKPDATKFKKTTTSETIHKYGFYEYTETHPDQIEYFVVPRRFAGVFKEVGLSNPDSLLGNMVDGMFSKNGRVNVGQAVSGVRAMMSKHKCDSPTIATMEQNMLVHFDHYMQGQRKVRRALIGQ